MEASLDLATTHVRIAVVRRALQAALGTVVALLVACGPPHPARLMQAPAAPMAQSATTPRPSVPLARTSAGV
jgi:hypothetical protein